MKKEIRANKDETFLQWLMPSKVTIGLFVAYFLIIVLFLFFLNKKTQSGFGLSEIIFSIVGSFLLTSVLVWIKALEYKNAYLGLIIGIVTVAYLNYAIFIRYIGPYTISFLGVGSLITVAYLIVYFFDAKKEAE